MRTAQVVGNVGRIEFKTGNSGTNYAQGSIANEVYDRQQRKNVTEWVGFVVFGALCDRMQKAGVAKGTALMIAGEEENREPYNGKSQTQISVTSWGFAGAKQQQQPQQPNRQEQYPDDDLPF